MLCCGCGCAVLAVLCCGCDHGPGGQGQCIMHGVVPHGWLRVCVCVGGGHAGTTPGPFPEQLGAGGTSEDRCVVRPQAPVCCRNACCCCGVLLCSPQDACRACCAPAVSGIVVGMTGRSPEHRQDRCTLAVAVLAPPRQSVRKGCSGLGRVSIVVVATLLASAACLSELLSQHMARDPFLCQRVAYMHAGCSLYALGSALHPGRRITVLTFCGFSRHCHVHRCRHADCAAQQCRHAPFKVSNSLKFRALEGVGSVSLSGWSPLPRLRPATLSEWCHHPVAYPCRLQAPLQGWGPCNRRGPAAGRAELRMP